MPCPYCKKPTTAEEWRRGIDHKTPWNTAPSNCLGWFCSKDILICPTTKIKTERKLKNVSKSTRK